MKNFITIVILGLLGLSASAQTLGFNYQAVILKKNYELPGQDAENSPLVNSEISVAFSILDASMAHEYTEYHTVITDEFGMINILVGSGVPDSDMELGDVVWDGTDKYLEVLIDLTLEGNFELLAVDLLTYIPHPMDLALIKASIAACKP